MAEAPLVVAAEVLLAERQRFYTVRRPGAATVTIDPDAVPLANLPNEDGAADLLVIDDEDVPLAALPKTRSEWSKRTGTLPVQHDARGIRGSQQETRRR